MHQEQCFDADALWTEGEESDLPELLLLNKNES